MQENGKVLFVIHDVYQDDNHFPSGIGYMAAILKNQGTSVKIYNQDIFHFTNRELAEYLKRNDFDLIGVGFLAARFNETIRDLCKVINKFKNNAWLVLGGHGPSPIPDYMLKTTNADIIAIGEAEKTIVDLLKCKLENGDLSKVKGIVYSENDNILVNERQKLIKNLDSLPFPAWELFPMDKYTTCLKFYHMDEKDKALAISTSRGCINRCNFCYRMEAGIRFHNIKNVVEKIIYLMDKYGVTYFHINDELFTYPRKRIFEFHDELERNDLKIKFHCNARVDIIDEEVAKTLREAGCQYLNFGMESSDQKVLDLMKKNTTVEQNIHAAEISQKAGITVGLNFIWGNIGDTAESLKGNIKIIKKYNIYHRMRTIRPVTPYPGCELYYYAIQQDLLSGPEDFFDKFQNSDLFTVNFTNIPDDKFYKLLYEANKDLVYDHYMHTKKDMEAAEKLVQGYYNLYFKKDIYFRGARHYSRNKK